MMSKVTKPRLLLVLLVIVMSATFYYLFRPSPYVATVDLTSMQDPISAPSPSEVIEWKEYVSGSPSFNVEFPTVPQHAQESVPLTSSKGSIKYDLFLSQAKSGSTFMISIIEYPEGYNMENSESLLEGVQKEMLSANDKNRLISSNKGTFQACQSLDFMLETPDVVTKSIAFIHGRHLYVLTCVDRLKSDVENNFNHFTSSFQITANPAPVKSAK